MLTRINSLEKNINDVMKVKNTAWELNEAYARFNSWIDQAEERISEIEDQLNEIKWEGKSREKKSEKKRTKPPKKYGVLWKDLICIWQVYLNVMERMTPSWKTLFRILFRTSPT